MIASISSKAALQDGLSKKQIVLVSFLDKNGKNHFIAFENMEMAKKYSDGRDKRMCTLFVKEDS